MPPKTVCLAARRFLAEDVLEQLGAAAKASADMVANCTEAYLEELQLLGRPCLPAASLECYSI